MSIFNSLYVDLVMGQNPGTSDSTHLPHGARMSPLACLLHPLSAPILASQYWERNIGSRSTCTEYVDTFLYFGGSAFGVFAHVFVRHIECGNMMALS